MDWLDATTAALAIIAVPLALRYPLRAKDDPSAETSVCDCAATTETQATEPSRYQIFPQEEEPTQERQPDSLPVFDD